MRQDDYLNSFNTIYFDRVSNIELVFDSISLKLKVYHYLNDDLIQILV